MTDEGTMLAALHHYDRLCVQLGGDRATALQHTLQRYSVKRDDFRRALTARCVAERVHRYPRDADV